MQTNCYHGIVFAENEPSCRKSCLVCANLYCLAPATVLINSFDEFANSVNVNSKKLLKDLKLNRLIDTNTNPTYRPLQSHNFKIIHADNDGTLYESSASIVNIFSSRNIWNSFNDILRGFVAKSTTPSSPSSPLSPSPESTANNELHKILLSSFIVLRIKRSTDADNQPFVGDPNEIFSEIVRCLSVNGNENVIRMNSVNKLECIESVTTPFGNECFLNTINVGRIANIFGDNKCLMVASMPLVNGCEGGAVYNGRRELIGIVISTTFDWNNENATLTLVARFNEILAEFVHQSQVSDINIEDEIKLPALKVKPICEQSAKMENFIVLIQSSSSWGSGCFIKIGDMRLIITCAHVLENNDDSVLCTWKHGRFSSNVIFVNPFYDEAFDIAILEAPADIPEKHFTRCHTMPTSIGDMVYSSGFPHFTSLGNVKNFVPSIFEGRITKISKGVIFSDASVQSGQSGGPMFTNDGRLMAVCISNSKDDQYQLIYPNINMSVPIFDIFPILQNYERTKGKPRNDRFDFIHIIM